MKIQNNNENSKLNSADSLRSLDPNEALKILEEDLVKQPLTLKKLVKKVGLIEQSKQFGKLKKLILFLTKNLGTKISEITDKFLILQSRILCNRRFNLTEKMVQKVLAKTGSRWMKYLEKYDLKVDTEIWKRFIKGDKLIFILADKVRKARIEYIKYICPRYYQLDNYAALLFCSHYPELAGKIQDGEWNLYFEKHILFFLQKELDSDIALIERMMGSATNYFISFLE